MNNREIKFKILKLDINCFLYNEERTILEIGKEDLEAIRHNPDNYKFIQYTNLKDKNGKEIYEGDIIEFQNEEADRTPTEVKWEDHFDLLDDEWFDGKKYTNTEIIGNIYENPELIK